MNWFKNHLNWTYGVSGAICFIGAEVGWYGGIGIGVIVLVICLACLIWLSRWVLKEKNRPLWIAIFAPFFIGWLYILCCYNRSEEVLAARDSYLGDISMKVKYFAYGSNMCTRRLKKRVSSAEPLGRAKLLDKSLVCNKKGEDGSGKANLKDTARDTVWGVLYEIDLSELHILDEYEKGYKRISLDVVNDQDSSIEAYVYVSSALTDDARPYDSYKEFMIKGAREHHLPSFYVTRLEQIESKPDKRRR